MEFQTMSVAPKSVLFLLYHAHLEKKNILLNYSQKFADRINNTYKSKI